MEKQKNGKMTRNPHVILGGVGYIHTRKYKGYCERSIDIFLYLKKKIFSFHTY